MDDPVPSYEDSVQQGDNKTSAKQPVKPSDRPMTLNERFRLARSNEQQVTTQRIARFITECIEPLLEIQASSGVSKTLYIFLPSDMDARYFEGKFAPGQTIVEGFGGCPVAVSPIPTLITRELVKIVRLTGDEYSSSFWKDPLIKDLETNLKARLLANGERLDSADACWCGKSVLSGENISPGLTGICVHRTPSTTFHYDSEMSFYVAVQFA